MDSYLEGASKCGSERRSIMKVWGITAVHICCSTTHSTATNLGQTLLSCTKTLRSTTSGTIVPDITMTPTSQAPPLRITELPSSCFRKPLAEDNCQDTSPDRQWPGPNTNTSDKQHHRHHYRQPHQYSPLPTPIVIVICRWFSHSAPHHPALSPLSPLPPLLLRLSPLSPILTHSHH